MEYISELSTWVTEEGGIFSLAIVLHCSRVALGLEFTQASRLHMYKCHHVRKALRWKETADWYSREEEKRDQLHGHATCAVTQLCTWSTSLMLLS